MAGQPAKEKTNPPATGGRGRRNVTSYDVARHAGVSQSAVSRCFKPGASVSKKMREKVMKVATELGYKPNAIARSLITRRSNLVAVIISNLTNLYYPEVLAQLTQRFSDRGIHVLLFALEAESQIDDVLQQVFQYQVDGAISAARLSGDQVNEFSRRGVPLVFYNRIFIDGPVNAVCCDQSEGARMLIDGLVQAGHKRFAIIGGPKDNVVGVERCEASTTRLKELGHEVETFADGDFSYECGRDAVEDMGDDEKGLPDAIICANDMSAIGAIDAIRYTFKKSVPGDVSVVGFDGVGPANWASFDLTTIRQPVGRMSKAAVAMLAERIEDPDMPPEKRVFSGILISGSSARLDP